MSKTTRSRACGEQRTQPLSPRSPTRSITTMSLHTGWPHLQQDTRDWLIAHNSEALSQSVVHDIEQVAG